ncbi:DUF1254 domain-containing protein [Allorhodopirellula solitaria]|uniref:DUF1254 domain-containing protein n=1 Tax=Allorhodopirellula solitaria TaxID=2527987 RepID=A0A5C5XVS8_9BACT|nr:DUF1214 domain-containing protein [Allorhodopirellula solitaria]TWT66503.1 hypothetical protein CA85_25990 [Allorhodopirellula solitaria]
MKQLLLSALAGLFALCGNLHAADAPTPEQAREIAKQAYFFAYPVVMDYRTMYAQAIKGDREFGKWIHLGLSKPSDTDIVTPNNDTPYSYAWLDLRAEPWVLTVPKVEPKRFITSQWNDMFGFVVDNAGSVNDGNDVVKVLLASPSWKGDIPEGVDRVIQGESDLLGSLTRTQVIGGESDMPRVSEIQQGYKLQPLSAYTGGKAPAAAPAVDWPAWTEGDEETLKYWDYFSFVLPFITRNADDQPLYDQLASLGMSAEGGWKTADLDAATQTALKAGIDDARAEMKKLGEGDLDANKLFGPRKLLGTRYRDRAMGVYMGIFANTSDQSFYISMPADSKGQPLDGSKNSYTLTFTKENLPPVEYFWSITLYNLPQRFLVENPIKRYSIGSATPGLKYEDDGSLIIHVSAESPGKDLESNWLPAPKTPFWTVLRSYGPDEAIIKGTYNTPAYQPTPVK